MNRNLSLSPRMLKAFLEIEGEGSKFKLESPINFSEALSGMDSAVNEPNFLSAVNEPSFLRTNSKRRRCDQEGKACDDEELQNESVALSPKTKVSVAQAEALYALQHAPNPKLGINGTSDTKYTRIKPEARLLGGIRLFSEDMKLDDEKFDENQPQPEYGPEINPRDRVFWEDYVEEDYVEEHVEEHVGIVEESDMQTQKGEEEMQDAPPLDSPRDYQKSETEMLASDQKTDFPVTASESKESCSSSSPLMASSSPLMDSTSFFQVDLNANDLNGNESLGSTDFSTNLGFFSYTNCPPTLSQQSANTSTNATNNHLETAAAEKTADYYLQKDVQKTDKSHAESSSSRRMDETQKKGTTERSTETGEKVPGEVKVQKKRRATRRSSITKRLDALDLSDD